MCQFSAYATVDFAASKAAPIVVGPAGPKASGKAKSIGAAVLKRISEFPISISTGSALFQTSSNPFHTSPHSVIRTPTSLVSHIANTSFRKQRAPSTSAPVSKIGARPAPMLYVASGGLTIRRNSSTVNSSGRGLRSCCQSGRSRRSRKRPCGRRRWSRLGCGLLRAGIGKSCLLYFFSFLPTLTFETRPLTAGIQGPGDLQGAPEGQVRHQSDRR